MTEDLRFSRQTTLVPSDKLANTAVTVVGVGAIGRQAAMQLAAVGVRHLQLIDFDTVELANVASQGFPICDIGKPKVVAVQEAINTYDPDITVFTIVNRYCARFVLNPVVFCCVDSMKIRKLIWKQCKDKIDLWIDARMLSEIIRVLVVDCAANYLEGSRYYDASLFSDEEAERGRCTAKSTIYTANVAAGFMLQQFVMWLRRDDLNRVMMLVMSAGIIENR